MSVLEVTRLEVLEARRLDGLHLRIKTEEVPRTEGWGIHGVGDLIFSALAFGFIALYLGAPVLLVAAGAWLPLPGQGPYRTLWLWTVAGLALVSIPIWNVSAIVRLDSFFALHGPRRRALFLHRTMQLGPRLITGSLAWGGAMAGRMAASGVPVRVTLLLSLTAALLPASMVALVAVNAAWGERFGTRVVRGRSLVLLGLVGGAVLVLLAVFRLATDPSPGPFWLEAAVANFAVVAPGFMLVVAAALAREALRSFEGMEIPPARKPGEGEGRAGGLWKVTERPGPPQPFPTHRSRTVLGARLATLGGTGKSQVVIVVAFVAIIALLIAIGFGAPLSPSQGYRPWYLLPLVLCLMPLGGMTHRQRAWLLGMDLVAQRRHARAFALAVQVPVFCGSAAIYAAIGGDALRWSLVALMAGILAFRLGARGWEELASRTGWRSFVPRIPVYIFAIGLLLAPMAGWPWALVAAGGGAVLGLVGMGLETRLIGEETLLDGMRREAEAG